MFLFLQCPCVSIVSLIFGCAVSSSLPTYSFRTLSINWRISCIGVCTRRRLSLQQWLQSASDKQSQAHISRLGEKGLPVPLPPTPRACCLKSLNSLAVSPQPLHRFVHTVSHLSSLTCNLTCFVLTLSSLPFNSFLTCPLPFM